MQETEAEVDRRQLLVLVASGVASGLAGCGGDGGTTATDRDRDAGGGRRVGLYLHAFQLRRQVYRKPGREALKPILETALRLTNNLRHKSDN